MPLDEHYRLIILREVLDGAIMVANDLYPREVMLYLGGKARGGILLIDKLHYQHFLSSPEMVISTPSWGSDMSEAMGSFHSHPTGPALPSDADLEFFTAWPVNLIFSYEEGEVRAFDQDGNEVKMEVVDNTEGIFPKKRPFWKRLQK